jgi:recombination protein RecA
MGDSHVGLHARLMSQAMRKLAGIINKTNCVVIFINQIREKVGIMFGNPETTTGGRALKFYASVRLEIRRGEAIKDGAAILGNRTNIKVVKNKVAPPFKTAEVEIIYGQGISKLGEIVDLAVNANIIQRNGSWYIFGGQKIQGKDSFIRFSRQGNDDLLDYIHDRVIGHYFN